MTTRIACLLAIALLTASACAGDGGEGRPLSEMSIEPIGTGSVELVRGDEVLEITEASDLVPGDVVVTGDGQQARLRLEGDRNVWIGPRSRALVADEKSVEDLTGSVLVEASDTTSVTFGETEATTTNGVFRVDRRVATARAASYRGEVMLSSPGEARVAVAPLYQASVAAGDIARPKPYRVRLDDVWDGQWLEAVVALEADIARLASGFSNQLKRSRLRLDYFNDLAGRPVDFMRAYLRRPPADLFIGYAIADRTPSSGLAPAFKQAFALRDDGGSWGVVAAIMGVESKPLIAGLENLFIETGVVASGSGDSNLTVASSGSSQDPQSSTSSPPTETTGGTKPKKPKKPDEPDEPDECEGEISVDCAVQEVPLPDMPFGP